MTIQRMKPPTLEEIQRTIQALEREFHVSSAEFNNNREVYASLPEDVAADWAFALEQHTVLVQQYWKSASGPQRMVTSEECSVQECVAA